VCYTSTALHPALKATYLQPWGPSNLLLRPSALIPSTYLTHTSDSKKLIYISFLRPTLCYVLSCLSSTASCHLRLLPISVLLSFAVPCSRHFAPTTLIESSLHARVITPPLLSPEGSFFLWFCSGEFFLVNRDRQLAIPLSSREHVAMSRSVHSSYACRFCSLALMFRLELSVLRCFFSFASSFHPCPPLFRCYVLASLRLHYTH